MSCCILLALSEKECELWVKGLKHLVQDTVNAPYPLQVERWLRREFYAMENSREMYVFSYDLLLRLVRLKVI